MELKPIKLKKHESFSIREGWLEKGINIIHDNPLCFSKDEGTLNFGIGTNMVKSLRYWLEVCNIANFKQTAKLTQFGELLYHYDQYCEENFSWWFIHLFLSTNKELACVINEFFNMEYTKIEKESFYKYLLNKLSSQYEIGSESSLESDVSVLFKTYYANDTSNPEQNLNCPLAKLSLITYNDKKYIKTCPKYSSLSYLVVYYCFILLVKQNYNEDDESFNLEDLLKLDNNPLKIFNLSISILMTYLDEMKNRGLITVIKTAGLNTIKLEKKLNLMEIFKKYYEE